MFDNKEPQDIFEGVEPPTNLPVDRPAAAAVNPMSSAAGSMPRPSLPTDGPRIAPQPVVRPAMAAPSYPSSGGGHVVKTLIILLVAFVAIGASGFIAYRALMPEGVTPIYQGDETDGEDDIVPDGADNTDGVDDSEDQTNASIDTDGDGLTNAEELEAGTSISNPDTDNDELGDKEELQVYGTDPRRPDTDGDGYLDGEEVKGGFNPNGPGKILEVPTAE